MIEGSPDSPLTPRRAAWWLPWLCVLAAAGLAAWSVGFGLPYLFRPDEDVMVGRSVRMAVAHSLDPLFNVYPPLAFYAFAAAETVAGLLPGVRLGAASAVLPSSEYLAARAVSVAAFAACVGLVYLAGRRAYGRWAGILAAACLAVAPLAVRTAHFATTDTLAMTFVAATILAGLGARDRGGYALAGALAGLGAATKYTSGAVVVFLLVLIVTGEDRRGRLLAALASAAAAFAVVVGVAGHPGQYLQGIRFLAGRAGGGYGGAPIGLLYHPTRSLPFGLGPGIFVLSMAGIVVGLARRERVDLALLAFVAAYFGVIGVSHEVFFRYALPMFPALCLLAGGAVRAVPRRRRWPVIAGLAAATLLLPSALASVAGDRLLGQADTRVQAADWLQANAPAGSEIRIHTYWGQPLYGPEGLGAASLHPIYATGDPVADSFELGLFSSRYSINRSGSACFDVLESAAPDQGPPPAAGRYLARFRPGAGDAPAGAVYDRLDSFYLPIWGLPIWSLGGLDRPGPAITIAPC